MVATNASGRATSVPSYKLTYLLPCSVQIYGYIPPQSESAREEAHLAVDAFLASLAGHAQADVPPGESLMCTICLSGIHQAAGGDARIEITGVTIEMGTEGRAVRLPCGHAFHAVSHSSSPRL